MKILVTGANGQLGSEIKSIASKLTDDVYTFVDIDEMDLGSATSINDYFQHRDFDFVISCGAYTAVDKAEEENELAYRINAESIRLIAAACAKNGSRLIHISTDYVFDGGGNQPIDETAVPNPLSVYGRTKLEGEKFAFNVLSNAYVIRTAWVYSSFGKNFVKTIAKLAREKDELRVVYDQIGSPTYARDLASVIIAMIAKIKIGVDVPGVYHYSNEGVISWYDLAWFIVDHYKLKCKVIPIRSEEYKTLAIRPKFSVLEKRLIKDTFDVKVPHWKESLGHCLDQLGL